MTAEIDSVFLKLLYDDLSPTEGFLEQKPLLAHYTTIEAVEKILSTQTVLFSNPLFMNDSEEVRFGLLEGDRIFRNNAKVVTACGDPDRANKLFMLYDHYWKSFVEKDVADTYVFCLSVHPKNDFDGRLSMWRGYGGNGNGAALVFDTAKLSDLQGSPLIVAKVEYETRERRIAWIEGLIDKFCVALRSSACPDDALYIAAHRFFERLKLFALFAKHKGFEEEQEWRIVYMRERDNAKIFDAMFDCTISPKGIEPKLKFKVGHIQGATAPDTSLAHLIDRIILGPSVSSPIAASTFKRMLSQHGMPEIAEKTHASTIPLRA